MDKWFYEKTRVIMWAKIIHVTFSDPLQKQYRFGSVNKQAKNGGSKNTDSNMTKKKFYISVI